MKIFPSALVALFLADEACAFVPASRHNGRVAHNTRRSLSASMVEASTDVSIPYDAAARLAYDEWRAKFSKGAFDEKRYQNFKTNYETITVANVAAKKKARGDSTFSLSLMSLNEFGDCSEAEYNEKMKATSTGDVLGQAVEAAALQAEASTALGEAADALAVEEQKLVEKLGLESVEELEVALDSLEGIADDGGELESENIAQEARIREAYLNWCKDFGKEPDESRFPTFSQNFLTMEQYAKESGKAMNLNEYADFTKEEYDALQSKKKAAAPKKKAPEEPKGPSQFEVALENAAKVAAEAREKAIKEAEERIKKRDKLQAEEEAAMKEKMEAIAAAEEKTRKLAEEARKKKAAEVAKRAKEEADRRKQIEKERSDRQKAKEEEIAKAQAEQEAAVIAAAKAEREKEEALAAQRAKFEAQAAEKARQQAAEWEKKMAQRKTPAPALKPKQPVTSLFGSILQPKAKQAKEPKKDAGGLGGFLAAPVTPKISRKPSPKPKPVSKAPTPGPKKKPAAPAFSFFSPPAPKKAAPKPVAQAVPAPKPAPKKAPAFSFFAAPKPKPSPKKVQPKPAPALAPVAKKAPAPAFSFFSAPGPKPAPTPVAKVVPAPTPTPRPSFSIFGSKPTAKKAPAKPEVKVPKRGGTINLFGSQSAKPKVSPAQKKAEPKIPSRSGTISLFGGTPKPKAAPKEATAPGPASKPRPSLSLFASKKVEPKPESKKEKVSVPNRSGTISLFAPKSASKAAGPAPAKEPAKAAFSFFGGGSKPAPKAAGPPPGIPVLSKWKKNPNGSITGNVSGAKGFRNGTEITTSAVRGAAKAGSVVTTGSGSKYYLQ